MRRPCSRHVSPADAAGFALLALLALLVAGSAAVLLTGPGRGVTAPERALDELARLVAARDALLAYTATYPERYGPTGAGPGHLPCPDTDDAFRLAGPNPPCGRDDVAVGRLPAHVTVASARAGLDVGAGGAPIGYRLAARAANNPARRPLVTAGTVSRAGLDGTEAIATLSLAARDGAALVVRVRADELAAAAERRVSAWLALRAVPPDGEGDPRTSDSVAAGTSIDASDDPSGDDGLDVLALVTRREPAAAARPATAPAPGASAGPTERASAALVDGVPRARHWFVADGWAGAYRATVEPGCRESAHDCRWRIDDSARRRARGRTAPEALPRIELTFGRRDRPDESTRVPRS